MPDSGFKIATDKHSKITGDNDNCRFYVVHSIRFQTFFVQAFKIVVDS